MKCIPLARNCTAAVVSMKVGYLADKVPRLRHPDSRESTSWLRILLCLLAPLVDLFYRTRQSHLMFRVNTMSDEFLFVIVKTPSTLKSKDKRHDKAKILSYVQQSRRKAERKARASQRELNDKPQKLVCALDAQPLVEAEAPRDKRPRRGRLPLLFPSHNFADPFHCTVAAIDAGTHTLLRHTFDGGSAASFLAEAFAPMAVCTQARQCRHSRMFHHRQQQCIRDPVLMYASLSYGSSLLAWTGSKHDEGRSIEYFVGKAISHLGKRLAEEDLIVDNWLLLSIYSLAITEMWNGTPSLWENLPARHSIVTQMKDDSLQACRTHLQVLWRLTEDAGGWQSFDPYIYDCFLLAIKYLSIVENQPPIFAMDLDFGPLIATSRKPSDPSGATASYPSSGLLQHISNNRLRLSIIHLIEHFRSAKVIWNEQTVTSRIESLLFRKQQAIILRLQQLSFRGLPLIDQCICLTALATVLSCTIHNGPQAAAKTVTQRLYSIYRTATTHETKSFPDCLRLWVLFSGAMVIRDGAERSFFMRMIREHLPMFYTVDDARHILETYLYVDERQDAQLRLVFGTIRP